MNMHVKPKAELKAGDRVRVTHTDYPSNIPVGVIAKIARIDSDGDAWLAERDGDDDGLFFYGWEFEPVKFAVGDKVRVVKDGLQKGGSHHREKVGNIIIVKGVWDTGVTAGSWAFNFDEIEPYTVPSYSSCAAAEVDNLADEYGGGRKVAAREPGYRFTDKDRPASGDKVSIGYQGTFTVKDVTASGNIRFADRPGGQTWQLHDTKSSSDCTLVQAATTLRIEAGKFYKTRDGRKVGPARLSEYPSAKCKWSLGELWLYQDDGTAGNVSAITSDLIAEWQDEPVVAEAKFKVGDRVKFRDDYNSSARGKDATVVKVDEWGVQVDRGGGWLSMSTEQPSDLVFLSQPTTMADIVRKHAIVAVIEDGQPKPATQPYVHADRASAATEANRLATVNKGQEFGVYELVSVAKVEKTYDHEWQRLAAGGQKIAAIKEIRAMTGLGLATTKDAVEDWLRREAE